MHLRVLLVLLSLLIPAAFTTAMAHQSGQSYLFLRIYDEHLEARLEITAADLSRALGIELSEDADVAWEQVRAHLGAIVAYVDRHFSLRADQEALPMRFISFDLRQIEIADFVLLHYTSEPLDPMPREIDVEYGVLFETSSEHRNLVVIEHHWESATFNNERNVSLVLAPGDARQTLDLSSSSVWRGFLGLVKLGTWHIWIGWDHLLFLLALALPAVLFRQDGRWASVPTFRPALVNIATLVTIFTVAHTITLSLAALRIVDLPARMVEPIIAASIAVAALHNLYPRYVRWDRAIAFVFGLFHGFGFASVLGEFGLESRYLTYSLLGFNLGVELGQLAILLLAFPILYLIRSKRFYIPVVLRYGSMMLIVMALVWCAERVFEVQLVQSPRQILRLAFAHFN